MSINTFKSTRQREQRTRAIFLSLIFGMVISLYIAVWNEHKNYIKDAATSHFPVQHADAVNQYCTVNNECSKSSQNIDLSVNTFQELKSKFIQYNFMHNSAEPHMHVPRLCLVALPKNFKQASISSKKKLFVKSLLPLILRANENILTERHKLLEIISDFKRFKKFKIAHKQWIADTCYKYRIKKINLTELKKRIDIIPPSLALGQAIIETGWGTSHSAMIKNSTFGLTVDDRVLSYDSLLASVENYMLNMNAHNAYNEMRMIRSSMRQNQQKICSIKLLKGLNRYSIRRGAYLSEIENIINAHNLKAYDNATLINANNTL